MKISLKWLCDHVDVVDFLAKPNELAKVLTDAGLEVEGMDSSAESLKSVVVGHIERLERHPNADRLTVCQVNTGSGGVQQIVCGATNHKVGDKVVVALPGAVLPGDFAIKKSKIRDVESLGMLASESELGLKTESVGILILPADAPVGQPFAEYFGLDDITYEVNVPTSRADCLSHLGVARELSCLLDRPLKVLPTFHQDSGAQSNPKVEVELKDSKLCTRYAGRMIEGVKVGPSPAWLRRRLESVGMNSINNVVDVTNFIMMDLGQPLHAFDVSSLKGRKILVGRAAAGENFTTFDGTQLKLTGDELTIRDAERAVCLAGVVGSLNSGVTETTQDLFIEAAHFTMDSVRKTARRHGLQTDSAYRFSRGTDPSGVVRALGRACQLIQEVAGGQVSPVGTDLYPNPVVRLPVMVRAQYLSDRLGYPVDPEKLQSWLLRLGCKVEVLASGLQVTPPEYRVDLEQEVDFVEEYGRLNGYDHIPESLPVLSYAPLAQDKNYLFEQHLGTLARTAGFSQCINFGFTSSKYQASVLGSIESYKACGLEMDPQAIAIQNPLNEELDVMRISLLPGLLRNLLHNVRHGNGVGRLFELGFVFRRGPEGYLQEPRLAFAAWGLQQGLWQKSQVDHALFFELKTRLQGILDRLMITQVQFNPLVSAPELLHPGQSASVFVEGRNIGVIGAIHPRWQVQEKVRLPVVIGELDVKALTRGQPRVVKYKPVSKFPAVERDIAFLVPKGVAASDVMVEIKKTIGTLLQSVQVFDVFEGAGVPEGHQSIAYRMVLQDLTTTLDEEKLTALQAQLVTNVSKKLNIKVR